MRQSALFVLLLLLVSLAVGGCGDTTDSEALGDEAIQITSAQTVNVSQAGSDPITITVPDGAQSMLLVVDGSGESIIIPNTIVSPSGEVVWDFQNDIATNRVDANDSLFVALIPSNPDVNFESGDWTVTLLTGDTAAFDVDVRAIIKTEAASANALDVNLFFVGVEGLDATTAPDDARFQALIDRARGMYQTAGLSLGEISYHDITGPDAERYGVLDSLSGPGSELAGLLALSSTVENRAMNLFFVGGLNLNGTPILGRSGSVPGPANLHGTNRSGVVVNMASYVSSAGDEAAMETEDNLISLTFVHESGHYLGLFHTTEKNGAALDPDGLTGSDPLSDTAVCPDTADANMSGALDADECEDGDNLMFWAPVTTAPKATSQQQTILRQNPIVR